jgi:hypothetical protein
MRPDPARTRDFLPNPQQRQERAEEREDDELGTASCNIWQRWSSDSEGRRRRAPAEELTRPQIRPATPPLPDGGVHPPECPPVFRPATTTTPARRRRGSRGGAAPPIAHRVQWRRRGQEQRQAGAVAACGS